MHDIISFKKEYTLKIEFKLFKVATYIFLYIQTTTKNAWNLKSKEPDYVTINAFLTEMMKVLGHVSMAVGVANQAKRFTHFTVQI